MSQLPLVAPPYDAQRAHDLAMAAAGIVPVLLVAAFAMPARRAARVEEAARVLGELLFGAVLLGLALVTEMLALFGVAYGLGPVDERFMFLLMFLTGVATVRRLVAPLIWDYADDRDKPTARFWWLFGIVVVMVSVGMTFALGAAEA